MSTGASKAATRRFRVLVTDSYTVVADSPELAREIVMNMRYGEPEYPPPHMGIEAGPRHLETTVELVASR